MQVLCSLLATLSSHYLEKIKTYCWVSMSLDSASCALEDKVLVNVTARNTVTNTKALILSKLWKGLECKGPPFILFYRDLIGALIAWRARTYGFKIFEVKIIWPKTCAVFSPEQATILLLPKVALKQSAAHAGAPYPENKTATAFRGAV